MIANFQMLNLRNLILYINFIYSINAFMMNMSMPGVMSNAPDEYICASFPISTNVLSYITSYAPAANSSVAHHMLLFGCTAPYSSEPFYPCMSICKDGKEKILFAWGNNAQKFEYPTDTGMAISGKTGINYFVLQVHYLIQTKKKDYSGFVVTITEETPKYVVGIFLMFSYYGVIPPKKSKVNMDISCRYQGSSDAYTLAYRTHAHALGRSISGFKVSVADDQIELIGKANPQWPQTFYKSAKVLVKPGDILMARCLFDSQDRDTETHIGSTHHDEMCNFYIMMVTKNTGEESSSLSCGGNEFKDLWKNIPSYSMEYDSAVPSPDLFLTKTSLNDYRHDIKILKADEKWKVNRKLGQVCGVSILIGEPPSFGYTLFVLHRGSHKWTGSSFIDNVYQERSHPISESAILEIDSITGNVLREAGRNLFFLPHGITVTKDRKYVWITDVGLHQVMRFNLRKDSQLVDDAPSIVLGEKFVNGNDRNHFCKPAQVAVDSRGFVFIADGYCNKRVVCLSPNGTYLDEWRANPSMLIVHSITIEEDVSGNFRKNVVWIADRENRRLIGFNFDGSIKSTFSSDSLDLPIFSIEYNPKNQLIYGISSDGIDKGISFTFNVTTFTQGQSWNKDYPLHFPHDLCLAENGTTIFVAELQLQGVVKFHLDGTLIKNPILTHTSNFNKINDLVKNMNPIIIASSLILIVVLLLVFIILLKYYRRFHSSKIRPYGHAYKDKEGFRPLKQDDESNEEADSDPETEEYAIPRGHPLKKQKA